MNTQEPWLRLVVLLSVAVLSLVLGIRLGSEPDPAPSTPAQHEEHAQAKEEKPTAWFCSMHPQIRLPEPGKCPICFMDLIPVKDESGEQVPRQLKMSEAAKLLAEVRTAPVVRRSVSKPIRMVGKVDYDETRMATIASWVNGRIERMYVDFTGISVKKGDRMVRLYSPDLLATQQELILAARSAARFETSDNSPSARTSRSLLRAAEERLRLWGLTPRQIAKIRARGRPTDYVTIYSPLAGVVTHKNGIEGMYVKPGTRIYTIADLSVIWVHLEAYESDLPWLNYGQEATITVETLPGEVFHGRVSFINPFLDEKTRTVKVRVVLENPDGRLRPGVFVRGTVESELLGEGLPLPLVIPASAPLITGKRAVVYVEVLDTERPTYEGREVVLGPRAGEVYIVRSGLTEGEQVVVEGNFKIDSAMQILAKPSMMNPEGGGPAAPRSTEETPAQQAAPRHFAASPEFRKSLMVLLDGYLALQLTLAKDDLKASMDSGRTLPGLLKKVDMSLLTGKAHHRWMEHLAALEIQAGKIAKARDLASLRAALSPLSSTLITVVEQFGYPSERTLFKHHCPMAFDNRGAWWLQRDEQVSNPYFGESMLRCADKTEPIPRPGGRGDSP